MKNLKIIINGPSGVGKTTIIDKILSQNDFELSISYTTRQPRNGEKHGVEYNFINKDEFLKLKNDDFFIETEEIFSNLYGTPRILSQKDIIFNLGIEGVKKIKDLYPDAITIFIEPPSIEELENRLKNRSPECIKRLNNLIVKSDLSDYVVINDNLEEAVNKIMEIIKLEKYR